MRALTTPNALVVCLLLSHFEKYARFQWCSLLLPSRCSVELAGFSLYYSTTPHPLYSQFLLNKHKFTFQGGCVLEVVRAPPHRRPKYSAATNVQPNNCNNNKEAWKLCSIYKTTTSQCRYGCLFVQYVNTCILLCTVNMSNSSTTSLHDQLKIKIN